MLVGGAAINRNFGLRILYPNGTDSDEIYEPGVFYCKDAFEGLAKMDQLIDREAREALITKTREAARRLREQPAAEPDDAPPTTDASVRSAASTDTPDSRRRRSGASREIDVPLDEVYHHLDTHVLFKLHWGGRGVKGEEWTRLLRDDFQPRLERMWREQTYLHPRALLGYFPCNSDGNELIIWDPEEFDPAHPRELERLVFPRQPKHDRICLADFYRPLGSGIDVVAIQAVTAGDEVTELMARLERDGEFAEQLFVHGLGVQTAEGMAEWLHSRVRADLGIAPDQGRRYSWGYPACPEQSEHEKVFRLLDAPVDRAAPVRRLRRRAGAVDARDRRPPPAGRVLRDEVGLPAEDRQAGARRADRRHRQGPGPARRAQRRGPGRRGGRLAGRRSPRWPRPKAAVTTSRCRPQRLELAALGQLGQRPALEPADRVLGDAEPPAGLAQRRRIVAADAVAKLHDLPLALGQAIERAAQRVVAQGDLDLLLGPAILARQQRAERGRPPRPPAGRGSSRPARPRAWRARP